MIKWSYLEAATLIVSALKRGPKSLMGIMLETDLPREQAICVLMQMRAEGELQRKEEQEGTMWSLAPKYQSARQLVRRDRLMMRDAQKGE